MVQGRYALIRANNEYQDLKLKRLSTPIHNAKSLADVRKDPAIGRFEVKILLNEPSYSKYGN
jgi:hypothetical protein